mmetsp:Transcript_27320/g.79639  ORF Transcript_27320/g.79639 Transcript_27320/m.79639 type:complete len:387 (-) Transcript_27320:542-1702(-)
MQIMSLICSSVRRATSLGRYWAKPRAPLPRGTIVTLRMGSACSRNQPATAWPASWYATMRFSSGEMILPVSRPPMTRSVADSKSEMSIWLFFRRAATIAASLQMLAMSAPAKPGVSPARRPAKSATGPARVRPRRCTSKISFRPWMSGLSTWICRSKRPGRTRAWSRMSTRFVPARTTMFVELVNPSISTRSWLRVFSRSSFPPEKPPRPRWRPTASISSINTMQGALVRASLKRSLTRDGPTPTNISMKSDPDMEKNGTLASPAVALARSVLPVPGGPQRSAPLGILAPSSVNRRESLRNSTNSMISFLASLHPATSLKVTFTSSGRTRFALDLPIWKMPPIPPPPPAPPMPRIMKSQTPMIIRVGASLAASASQLVSDTYWTGM